MSDQLTFAESVDSESSEPLMQDKQYLYVNDSNNGSYSGQIVLDSTSISNSGAWLNWSEAFITVPLVLQIEGPTANFAATNPIDYALALKSGYWQILHSMSVELNNGSVVQTSNFLNVFSSFKNLTSWSDADLKNWGAVCGFFPDTASSWIYNSLASSATNGLSANGLGICNNRTAFTTTQFLQTTKIVGISTPATVGASSKAQCANLGLAQRQKWLVFGTGVAVDGTLSDDANRVSLLGGAGAAGPTGLNTIFQSYIRVDLNATPAGIGRTIVFDAVIRLKDVCDFFAKMPLIKGSSIRLYLNTNQTYFTVNAFGNTIVADGTVTPGSLSLATPPVILGGGATNPIMLSSADLGQGLFTAVNTIAAVPTVRAVSTFKVALSIVRTQFSQMSTQVSAPIQSVRLYCPAYTMTAQAEARYLAMSPTKKVVYEDFFQYTVPNISGSFNVLVSNGLPNLRSVLVVGTIDKASNGTETAAGGNYSGVTSSSLLSPFSSTGGTPDPIPITQFQVQLSGKNSFNQNQAYDYEQFVEQLCASNQLNGSMTTGLGSGLIGYNEFEQLYRYYYVNASRGNPQDMGVSKSIQIQGTNQSAATASLLVFASFERSVVLNVASGQVVV
jgi:hypothetical protein